MFCNSASWQDDKKGWKWREYWKKSSKRQAASRAFAWTCRSFSPSHLDRWRWWGAKPPLPTSKNQINKQAFRDHEISRRYDQILFYPQASPPPRMISRGMAQTVRWSYKLWHIDLGRILLKALSSGVVAGGLESKKSPENEKKSSWRLRKTQPRGVATTNFSDFQNGVAHLWSCARLFCPMSSKSAFKCIWFWSI